MKEFLVLVVMGTMLAGCGAWSQTVAHVTGHSEDCVDGVTYLIYPNSVTVKYTPDGKVATCK